LPTHTGKPVITENSSAR